MKKSTLYFFMLITLLLSNCKKSTNDLSPGETSEWGEYCSYFNGGNFTISLNGSNWSTNCVNSVYTETISEEIELKHLTIFAYNHENPFFSKSEIEIALISWVESTIDNETSVSQYALFYDGFIDYNKVIADPDYELENLSIYVSDETETDKLNFTEFSEVLVSGNLNFDLFEEESGELVTMTGNFTANIIK